MNFLVPVFLRCAMGTGIAGLKGTNISRCQGTPHVVLPVCTSSSSKYRLTARFPRPAITNGTWELLQESGNDGASDSDKPDFSLGPTTY